MISWLSNVLSQSLSRMPVSRGIQGEILARIHKAGFSIVAVKSMRLTKEEAGGFYACPQRRAPSLAN